MSKKPHISDQQVIEVIERLADGLNLKESAAVSGLHAGNIYRRINESKELKELHARAREDYQRIRVDEMHHIAKTEPDVQRARLLCDNIKWEAARVLPKEYGDRLQHANDPDNPMPVMVMPCVKLGGEDLEYDVGKPVDGAPTKP